MPCPARGLEAQPHALVEKALRAVDEVLTHCANARAHLVDGEHRGGSTRCVSSRGGRENDRGRRA